MATKKNQLWHGLGPEAQESLATRDYASRSFAERLSGAGIEANLLAAADRTKAEVREAWIPGVEVFPRTIHHQRYRGCQDNRSGQKLAGAHLDHVDCFRVSRQLVCRCFFWVLSGPQSGAARSNRSIALRING